MTQSHACTMEISTSFTDSVHEETDLDTRYPDPLPYMCMVLGMGMSVKGIVACYPSGDNVQKCRRIHRKIIYRQYERS